MASSHVPVPAPLAASPVHVPVPDPAPAPEPTPMAPMAPFPVLVPSAPLAPLAPLPTFGVVSFASSPPDPPLPGPGHHLLFVGVLVNGILTKALVDTGASHSIVKTSWADRLCLLLLPSALSSISAADGRSLSITGSANAAIDLGSARLHALLTVVPDLAYDMVLGVDLLHRLKATVVVHARRLSSPLLLEPVDLFADAASVARAAAVEFTFAAPANPDEDPDLVPLSFMETSSSWDPSNWASLRDRAVVALPFGPVEKARFASTLDRHKAACAADPKAPGLANVEPFRIRTAEAYPIAHRARRFSPAERVAINDEVRRLLTSGIIRPSTSPWAAPIVPVPKPDGSIRICIDYRGLNRVTIPDKYPMPQVKNIFDQLHGYRYFSTFDLAAGFWQVPNSPEDIHKTAFVCELGLFEFVGMPMGPMGAPGHFQRVMDVVVSQLPRMTALPFMDDVISPATDFDDFLRKLESLLSKLTEVGLRLRLDKCRFCQPSVRFLGHTVSSSGLSVDESKTAAVELLARPTSVPELRYFVGLTGYYRDFIAHYAELSAPLTALTRKNARYVWSDACETAFLELKRRLASPPVLAFPDFARPFVLSTDSSKVAMGAVLSQPYPQGEKPVSFFSKQLRPAETRYIVSDLEALAVVTAVKHFRPYLHGRHFTVVTDHRALIFLLNPSTELSDRLLRWALKLQSFHFDVVYRKGSEMSHVDALSRLPRINALTSSSFPDVVLSAQIADPLLGPTRELLLFGTHPAAPVASAVEALAQSLSLDDQQLRLVLKTTPPDQPRLCIPTALRSQLMLAAHDSPTAGHLGSQRTIDRLRPYYWPSMSADVTNWCRSCPVCARRVSPRSAPRGLLQPLEPTYPGEIVVMDFLGPLPISSAGNRYVLVLADHFSKWVETVATPNADSPTVAKALVDRIVCRLGPPSTLVSDRGSHFANALIKHICSQLGIDQRLATAYHPQTQGLVERFNATLLDLLSKRCSADQKDWDVALPLVTWAYNSSSHPATGFTPFEIVHGTVPRSPFDLMLKPPMLAGSANSSVVDYVNSFRERLIQSRQLVLNELDKTRDRYRRAYDPHHRDASFSVNDQVMLYTPLPRKGLSPKLQSLWTGPWTVDEVVNPLNYVISLNGKTQLVSLTRLKPAVARKPVPPPAAPPATVVVPPVPPRFPAPVPALVPSYVTLPTVPLALPAPIDPVLPVPLDPVLPDPPELPLPVVAPDAAQDAHAVEPPFVPPGLPPPPPGEYYIDSLLDRRPTANRRGFEYFVRWQGYTPDHDEWIAASQLPHQFVRDYDNLHPRPVPPAQPLPPPPNPQQAYRLRTRPQ